MGKELSASQWGSILLAKIKEDMTLRRELISSIDKSNEVLSNGMTGSDSVKYLSETMAMSMQAMSQSVNLLQTLVLVLQMFRP